jgi:hypothetical protein
MSNVVALFNELPTELLSKLIHDLPGPALQLLSYNSSHTAVLLPHLRHRWLVHRGGSIGLAWEVSPRWAAEMYRGMTIWGRVGVVKGLLEEGKMEVAKQLARIDEKLDREMDDPTFGIYEKHLRWRFEYYQ